jgi:hypothetical protein
MAKVRYEIRAKTGTYIRDGQEKNSYAKIGVLFPNDDGEGFSGKIELVPAAGWDGRIYVSLPRENAGGGNTNTNTNSNSGGGRPQQQDNGGGGSNEIPF